MRLAFCFRSPETHFYLLHDQNPACHICLYSGFPHLFICIQFVFFMCIYLLLLYAGAVLYYGSMQISLLWVFHVIAVFWAIKFPFHSRAFKASGRFRYIHIIIVIVALLLPGMPVVAAFATGGYVFPGEPHLVCLGRDRDATFYSLILPVSVIVAVGVSLLIIILWIIVKVYT